MKSTSTNSFSLRGRAQMVVALFLIFTSLAFAQTPAPVNPNPTTPSSQAIPTPPPATGAQVAAQSPTAPVKINANNFKAEVLQSTVPVFVIITGDKCKPCDDLLAVVKSEGSKHKAKFVQVDFHDLPAENGTTLDKDPNFSPNDLPITLLFDVKGGDFVFQMEGAPDAADFNESVEALLAVLEARDALTAPKPESGAKPADKSTPASGSKAADTPKPTPEYKLETLTAANFQQDVVQNPLVSVVFLTRGGCVPCEALGKIINAAGPAYAGKARFFSFEVSEYEKLTGLRTSHIPEFSLPIVFIISPNGNESLEGTIDSASLKAALDRATASKP